MKRCSILFLLFSIVGCGTPAEPLIGPPGPQGDPGDQSVLSWAVIGGNPPAKVFSNGGKVKILSFTRASTGVYKIVYNVKTSHVGVVACQATGAGFELDDGLNTIDIIGAVQDPNTEQLTIDVVATSTLIDPSPLVLGEFDAIFSLVIFSDASVENQFAP